MTRALLAVLLLAPPAAAQKLTVAGGDRDLTNVVVTAPLPAGLDAGVNVVELPGGAFAPAQVSSDPKAPAVTFVLPKLPAGGSVAVRPGTNTYVKAPPHFAFADEAGKHSDVLFDGTPVLRFVNAPRDPARHYPTFKPFHQLFAADGKTLLTSGTAETAKDGQFPHHRGLFFGFNRIGYGDKKTADIWHGTNNVFSQADKSLGREAGEVYAREKSAVSWHGPDGATFAEEVRDVTVYRVPGGTLIDWATTLSTKEPKVRLDGDPQHAGFHFRANMEVSKNGKENTYYLRPDGKGKVGETRNWDPKKADNDPRTVNLPWNACSFVVGGKRYTVLRINHPDNPKDARGSERDYGRFGDYFEYDLSPEKPLKLKYRVWAQEGEMTVEQCQALAAAFVTPTAVK